MHKGGDRKLDLIQAFVEYAKAEEGGKQRAIGLILQALEQRRTGDPYATCSLLYGKLEDNIRSRFGDPDWFFEDLVDECRELLEGSCVVRSSKFLEVVRILRDLDPLLIPA